MSIEVDMEEAEEEAGREKESGVVYQRKQDMEGSVGGDRMEEAAKVQMREW